MLRRLLACLVALAIALPSAGIASARQVSVDCECPPGKSDCADKASACDCGSLFRRLSACLVASRS